MESQPSGWPTTVCLVCLVAAAGTICLQPRTQPAVPLSISEPVRDRDRAPVAVIQGTSHAVTVLETSDGYRFSVADSLGESVANKLTLTELDYEYPELRQLVESYGTVDDADQPDE
jgi:hypothetical protein